VTLTDTTFRTSVPGLLAVALVLGLGFDEGGFASTSWVWSVLPLTVVVAVLLAGEADRPSRLEVGFLAALAGLFGWTLLSRFWSIDPTASLLDAERLLLYLATAVALVLAARPGSTPILLVGILAALAVLCLAALGDAVVGDDAIGVVTDDPGSDDRLAGPVGYANGMALLAAMGTLLALGLSLAARRRGLRVTFLALIPLFVVTQYLTYSRGGWLALALGLLALLALRIGSLDRRLVVGLCAIVLVAVLAAGVAFARSFGAPTVTPGEGAARLTSLSGSSRADYWRVARQMVEDEPLLGSGAGGFRRRWYQDRPVPQPARDAHSLYLETLAELGPVGLVLLLAALGLPLAAAVSARGESLVAAAVGPYVAALAHTGQDWDWELPSVFVPALACAVALLLAGRREWAPLARAPRLAVSGAAVALAVLSLAAYAGNRELGEAERGSEDAARRAARLQPWSAEPWRARGEAQLERGDLERARESFREGLTRDDGDWELWLDLALASEGEEKRRAFDEAVRLNPRDPDLQELRGE
jgi:O-antigen ligase